LRQQFCQFNSKQTGYQLYQRLSMPEYCSQALPGRHRIHHSAVSQLVKTQHITIMSRSQNW